MVYSVGVETHALYLGARTAIVRRVHGIVKQKLRASFGRIDLDRHHDCGPDQNPFLAFFRYCKASLFQTKSPPQFCRDYYGSSSSDSGCR